MAFFTAAIDTLKVLVIALGAGLGIWGVINLLEGYGNDVTLKGGTFTSGGLQSAGVNVNDGSGSLSVTDEKVTIQNTGGGYGLAVSNAQSVRLSAGTYSGGTAAITIVSQSSPSSSAACWPTAATPGTPILTKAAPPPLRVC